MNAFDRLAADYRLWFIQVWLSDRRTQLPRMSSEENDSFVEQDSEWYVVEAIVSRREDETTKGNSMDNVVEI